MWARPSRKVGRASAVAGVLLAAATICALTASPAVAASNETPAQSVILEQSGGIAGMQMQFTVSQDTQDARRNNLLSTLGRQEFRTLPSTYGRLGCCDRFTYKLVVRYPNGQVKTITAVDGKPMPAVLAEAIDLTRLIADTEKSVRNLNGQRSLLFVQRTVDGVTSEWTVSCPSNGVSSRACAAVTAESAAALEPVAPGAVCTRIYGGPETARVYGVWQGQWVDATFDRSNGCEINRWDAIGPLLSPIER